jgi:predicted ribosome quality control (RQC) complex YloA/Tae2 family protein
VNGSTSILHSSGLPEDVWFHVEDLSSAHVYLRQKEGEDFALDSLPPALVNECAQLVKANSIEGSKLSSCGVVYTRWKNLKKTNSMDVGQVIHILNCYLQCLQFVFIASLDSQIGYHDMKKQRRIRVEKDKAIVNDLNRTKARSKFVIS